MLKKKKNRVVKQQVHLTSSTDLKETFCFVRVLFADHYLSANYFHTYFSFMNTILIKTVTNGKLVWKIFQSIELKKE